MYVMFYDDLDYMQIRSNDPNPKDSNPRIGKEAVHFSMSGSPVSDFLFEVAFLDILE
jgi:hypothetical protein